MKENQKVPHDKKGTKPTKNCLNFSNIAICVVTYSIKLLYNLLIIHIVKFISRTNHA